MHKHDLDLIAEYATGTLEDESVARARVESCEPCAQEYKVQVSALAALSAIGPAQMSEHERARMHRDLWTELRSPAAAAPPLARPWWRSWAFGAAGFILVAVSLVGVMENFGGGDGAETANTVAAELDSGADGSGDARADENTAGGAEEGEQFLSPDATTAAAESDDPPYALIAREVRRGPTPGQDELIYDAQQADCLEKSGLVDHELVAGMEAMTDLLVAVPSDEALETAPVSFIDPENCIVVYTED